MPRFIQMKIDNEWVLVDADLYKEEELSIPMIMGDTPDYQSPIDGRVISGRKQRREDLKRHNCVEYDPGIKQDAERIRRDSERNFQKSMESAIERTAYQLRDGMVKRETRINPAWLFKK